MKQCLWYLLMKTQSLVWEANDTDLLSLILTLCSYSPSFSLLFLSQKKKERMNNCPKRYPYKISNLDFALTAAYVCVVLRKSDQTRIIEECISCLIWNWSFILYLLHIWDSTSENYNANCEVSTFNDKSSQFAFIITYENIIQFA